MKNCVDIDEGKGIGRKKKLWNYTAEKKCVNCMLVHFADKLTKGEQKWMKKCSNAAFLQCNVIMTCRFCDSIKRYVDVVLLLIFFLLRQCSRCVFYLLYHNLFEFGGFFFHRVLNRMFVHSVLLQFLHFSYFEWAFFFLLSSFDRLLKILYWWRP